MRGFILAAGLGTRLRPWTLHHPKALVPVAGIPMLERVIKRMIEEGVVSIIINVHHFSGQIIEFLNQHDFGVDIQISDESELLLDTGGGLLSALKLSKKSIDPLLIHNVDILSDAPLADLMNKHLESGADISLITSDRNSSRKLIFDSTGNLKGWHNVSTNEYKPSGFVADDVLNEASFSGIYIVNPDVLNSMDNFATKIGSVKFPIMDFLLSMPDSVTIKQIHLDQLHLIDIGKPDTLLKAEELLNSIN